MSTDRDYGKKYIDFAPAPGCARLCLMERDVLAKDAGAGTEGDRSASSLVLTHRASTPNEVDTIVHAATRAGGRVTAAPHESEQGYTAHFSDLDGFVWKLTAQAGAEHEHQ
ncbi:VOC family protein [Agromyces aerolatus]